MFSTDVYEEEVVAVADKVDARSPKRDASSTEKKEDTYTKKRKHKVRRGGGSQKSDG
jgi:hypothetical protein